MKASIYNYYVNKNNKNLFFNGVTEKFFNISDTNTDKIKAIIQNPDAFWDKYPSFIEKLHKEGFIVDDDTDEFENVKKKHAELRRADEYRLMILPTYDCNLSCWYCTQEHKNIRLTDELIKRIKLNIYKNITAEEIKYFHLSWFGGEPLLCYPIVKQITDYSKEICDKYNVVFSCHITTNGILLNEQKIKELGKAGVTSFQITIDGCKEQHDKIKVLRKGSAFDATMTNVVLIIKNIPDVYCTLRYNYTPENLKPQQIINDLKCAVPEDMRSKIHFDLCKVWQADEKQIDNNKISTLFENAKEFDFHPQINCYGMCYADYTNFNCVFPNGRVGKCDNLDMDSLPAVLEEDGNISWPDNLKYIRQSVLDDGDVCQKCKHLPVCWGPCPRRREAMLAEHGKTTCYINNPDEAFDNHIFNMFNEIKKTDL